MTSIHDRPAPRARALTVRATFAALVVATAALYVHSLGSVPVYVGGDEARFATVAASLASTGRDLGGTRLPLFFHMSESIAEDTGGTRWYQPLLFYVLALTFRFVPLGERTIRLPVALIGVVDVVLMYFVARRLLGARWAALAAALLALSPAHVIFSRQALDYICPLPFVLGWLWCLSAALESGRGSLAFASGVVAGAGFYSYIAAWVAMPLLVLLACLVLYRSREGGARLAGAAAAGFALPVVAAVAWMSVHPDMWRDTIGRYTVFDPHRLSISRGLTAFFTPANMRDRVSVYWDYYNPSYLFFSGGSNLSTATRRAGVFLLPVGAFLVCGCYDVCRRGGSMRTVLLAGVAIAPLPATLLGERYAIQRELVLLPFATLIAASGVAFLVQHAAPLARAAAFALLLAIAVQFVLFYRDYLGDYRVRSALAFDPANIGGVADVVLASNAAAVPSIYLSEDLDDVAARWRFHLVAHRREELLARTSLFAADTIALQRVPAGSLLVLYANDPAVARFLESERCAVAAVVTDPAGNDLSVILRKVG